ncbi:acetyltransferase [Occultella kanbiaonis]|uniref:acetyltransferase n=1 Tax=Occultella kanbiaonis TaxID=2675754 RepID=UPI00143DA160|nr:acetyltransferase [Occultella kanbiaonis]
MPDGTVVFGASGFGREAIDVILDIRTADPMALPPLLGVMDDRPTQEGLEKLAVLGVRYLGPIARWSEYQGTANYVVGIGDPRTRYDVVSRTDPSSESAATIVHPSATVGHATRLGRGVIVCAGVQISNNVTLGDHVHMNPNSTVGHDARVLDFVSINPGAVISGDCLISDRVLIGANATVLQGLAVGAEAIVGAAACVVRDVAAGRTVKGVPAA